MSDLGHFRTPLRPSPFHPRTEALNRTSHWGSWAGYISALSYGDEPLEYFAIRSSASLYDISPMIKYRIAGPDVAAYLNRLTLRNAAKLPVGAVQYTAWCDDAGKVLDDGTLFRQGAADYLLCCQERHLPWLLDSAVGYHVAVADISEEIAAVSLQGPCAAGILKAAGYAIDDLKPFRLARFAFAGDEITISRTGFTGDLGYELWVAPGPASALWDQLMTAGAERGIRAVGTHAVNLARIEAGFIIANMDFVPADQAVREDRVRSPFELALDWMIDWDKGHFTGRRALLAERDKGLSTWALVGLDIDGNVSAEGSLVYDGRKREIGHITAAAWSPAVKRNIAIAQIRRPFHLGDSLWVEIYALRELQYVKLMAQARVTERPFFTPPRRRATPPDPF